MCLIIITHSFYYIKIHLPSVYKKLNQENVTFEYDKVKGNKNFILISVLLKK